MFCLDVKADLRLFFGWQSERHSANVLHIYFGLLPIHSPCFFCVIQCVSLSLVKQLRNGSCYMLQRKEERGWGFYAEILCFVAQPSEHNSKEEQFNLIEV